MRDGLKFGGEVELAVCIEPDQAAFAQVLDETAEPALAEELRMPARLITRTGLA